MTDAPKDPPSLPDQFEGSKMRTDHDDHDDDQAPSDTPPAIDQPKENLIHFNPWRDFNDAVSQVDAMCGCRGGPQSPNRGPDGSKDERQMVDGVRGQRQSFRNSR